VGKAECVVHHKGLVESRVRHRLPRLVQTPPCVPLLLLPGRLPCTTHTPRAHLPRPAPAPAAHTCPPCEHA
jgi:hypothetical protein